LKLKIKKNRTDTYKEKGKSNGDEGNASIAASKADYNGDSLVAFAGCANSDDEWILDSTASFHCNCQFLITLGDCRHLDGCGFIDW